MSPADRQKLLADVKLMDELASIVLNAPTSLKPGQEAQVTVTVKGGHGVVGVFLVDTDLRFQARPLQGDGWVIVRSEEHTSELQSQSNLVCRLLLEKKKTPIDQDCSRT